ncbi:MAG TPA: hypothetical protein VEL28_11475 [Candidatus Binatia bacterium]|nr:hypothetical protein [Candidatus Binatia bacterium]
MSETRLPRHVLDDLEREHVSFLQQRLVSPETRRDWIRGWRAAYEQLAGTPLHKVLDAGTIAALLRHRLATETARSTIAPIAREVHRHVVAALQEHDGGLGEYVPEDARRAIDAILEKRDLLPESLVRKVFEQQAVEDVLHDTLYDAITQFNTTVNPFFAEWGLPAILRRMPIGGSMILSSMEAMRGEFDKRLEPEIRRFLTVFSRRARVELAELVVQRGGDPKFVELRKNLLAFLYTQSLRDLTSGIDGDTARHVEHAAHSIVSSALTRDDTEQRLRAVIELLVRSDRNRTVGQWLAGIGAAPDVEAWAEAVWPRVEQLLRSGPVTNLLVQITSEFYAALKADSGDSV